MSRDLITIAARVEADSELAEQFEHFRENNSMTSKSEAVRHLLRAALAEELEQSNDVVDGDRDAARDDADSPTIDLNLIQGNEPIILGFAFLVGSNSILSALTAVAGDAGATLWGVTGLLLASWVIADAVASIVAEGVKLPAALSQRLRAGAK